MRIAMIYYIYCILGKKLLQYANIQKNKESYAKKLKIAYISHKKIKKSSRKIAEKFLYIYDSTVLSYVKYYCIISVNVCSREERKMESIREEIERLKKEKNAVLLAHYYVPQEVQEAADYVGDSYYLSKMAKQTDADMIVFAGVAFMGESAKILNPGKKVVLPDEKADCAMAHMASVEKVKQMRKQYEDLAVVCYINSTAELKTVSDVCVTSSNAVKIVSALPNQNIFFIPDGNLAAYVAEQVPEKHIIRNEGYCPVHHAVTADAVNKAKKEHPKAQLLVHPECTGEVLALADFVGSTAEIISYAKKAEVQEFLIGTEEGVLYELRKNNPQKKFYSVMPQCCRDMKLVTLEKVRDSLKEEKYQVEVDEETRVLAQKALDKMLELAK